MAARNPTPIGAKFNSLTILSEMPRVKRQNLKVLCRCDCGVVKDFYLYKMECGLIKTCGCAINRALTPPLIGTRFGRLSVTGPYDLTPGVRTVACRCDCGNIREVKIKSILDGSNRSCGCMALSNGTHMHTAGRDRGVKVSKIYSIWANMHTRCGNPKVPAWKDYGARGITVCERWKSFENFLADMGQPPDGRTLDRRDNSQGYSPENCRWADPETQANNKRNNNIIEFGGERLSLAQWARRTGLCKATLRGRIYDSKWPLDKALMTPARKRSKTL